MQTPEEIMRRYPRITAHIIAESLGYATPTKAALILRDAKNRQENWCEWIYSCYNKDALAAVRGAIRNRHRHNGYMSEYKLAKALVDRAIQSGDEPIFARLVLKSAPKPPPTAPAMYKNRTWL